jgi:DNA-binding transcriptional regulator GbsR (MarR family)
VTAAKKKAREIVQYFNKSTQATKKLKDQQHESSLTKYSGQPKNILQEVKTRWWSTYHMLKRLRFLREAISHYFVDYPEEADAVAITAQEWKIYYQIEITLKTMGCCHERQ